MITIFTAPKAFEGHIGRIQRNAIRSWLELGDDLEILMVGSEKGMDQAAAELGVLQLPTVARNDQGTPLLNSIFNLAREYGSGEILCYLNSDVMLTADFKPAIKRVGRSFERFLIVGQRWDVEVEKEISRKELSESDVIEELLANATRHPPGGSDYFIFQSDQYQELPPFALGRSGWDNWMIYSARANGVPVIDASQAITVLHQSHDYEHLPGGQSHYRLPESYHNVELAGGREMMFTLKDATWRLTKTDLTPISLVSLGFWRRLETALIAKFGPGKAAKVTRLVFHWPETLRYFFGGNKRAASM